MAEIEELKLNVNRYLYLSSENPRYIVSRKPSYNFLNVTQVPSLLKLIKENNVQTIIEIIETVQNQMCSNRETLMFVLAVCARGDGNELLKKAIYDIVLKICKTTQEFFLFIKFSQTLNKNFGHGLKRIVRDFYLKTEPLVLTDILTHSKSYYGWSHADIIKMVHLKSDDFVQQMLLTYAIKNLDEAKKETVDVKDNKITEVLENIIKKLDKLQSIKHCQKDKKAAKLIKENNFKLQQLPVHLLKAHVVWDALIPNMEIPALLLELERFKRLGLFKTNIVTKIVAVLVDKDKCKSCKINSAQVLIYMKIFEKGKPIDPQRRLFYESLKKNSYEPECTEKPTEQKLGAAHTVYKNTAMTKAFVKLLASSLHNQYTTDRKIMITIDVRDSYMSKPCFGNNTVTCLEAASVIVLSFLTAEKDTIIAVFNGDSVNVVETTKDMTFNQVHQKLKESTHASVLLSKPLQWAMEKKEHIDVFIHLIYSSVSVPNHFKNSVEVITTLKKYREDMKLSETKLVTVALGNRKVQVADGTKGVIDIGGFDSNVPRVLEAICRDFVQ